MSETAIQRRFRRIYDIGCLCCLKFGWFSECQVHHLNLDEHAGQKRLGDEQSIGICPWHHQGQPLESMTIAQSTRLVGPSLAHQPVKFREVFGSDQDLLRLQNELIEEAEMAVVGRSAA